MYYSTENPQMFFSLRIIHWTTKEQDDLDAKFIDEFFKKDAPAENPVDKLSEKQ